MLVSSCEEGATPHCRLPVDGRQPSSLFLLWEPRSLQHVISLHCSLSRELSHPACCCCCLLCLQPPRCAT